MEPSTKHFKKREAILNCVRSTDIHPSAEWVHTQVRAEHPDISLGTVYRNLSLFKEQGLIASLGAVKGIERFDGNTDPHVHFICTGCGKVVDLPRMQVPAELSAEAGLATGGCIQSCQLTFTGLCPECKNQN